MSVELMLANGITIVDGKEAKRSVAIHAGMIEGIYEHGAEPSAETIIDCSGKYILPGAIDIHVHLRDLEQTKKEDYISGTRAAAAGGVTTVVDMPNSQPPTLTKEILDRKIERAKQGRHVNVGFYFGLSIGKEDYFNVQNDVLGFKVYPHSPLDRKGYDPSRVDKSIEIAKKHRLPLLVHPDLQAETEPEDVHEFLKIHSCEQERNAIELFINSHKRIGGKLHICHVSCAGSAKLIIDNRAEDRLTAEVTPHHLFLSGADFTHEDGIAKMLPPLRSPYDNQALRDALCRCGIDVVASDHAPHTIDEKRSRFIEAKSGIPGLETLVPLMLTEVFENRLSWVEYLRMCCSGPASVLGLAGKGVLSKGYDADVIVVAKDEYRIEGKNFHSKAKYTPFEERLVKARPVMTIVGGEVVYSDGKFLVGPGNVGTVPVRPLVRPQNT